MTYGRKHLGKKASFSITAKTFVIIIIAIILLVLLLSLAAKGIKILRTLESQIPSTPPTALITSPLENEYYVIAQNLTFDGSKSYDKNSKIVGYHWDVDGDRSVDVSLPNFYMKYKEPGTYNITLTVINEQGTIGRESIQIIVHTNNTKDRSKYSDDMLFLIGDNLTTNEDNWRDILRLVPLTRWSDREGIVQYLYAVYFYTHQFENSDVVYMLRMHDTKVANFYGDLPLGMHVGNISNLQYKIMLTNKSEYFDYWISFDNIVLLDYDNRDSGLISALFSSFLNAPLIFVDRNNLNEFKNVINGKKVYVIDDIDPEVSEYIEKNAGDEIFYEQRHLRYATTNPFIKLASTILLPLEPS